MTQRWAAMISGTGSNLQAWLDRADETLPRVVYLSRAKVAGLSKAQRMGIPTVVLPSPISWDVLDQDLRQRRIEKIFLLGFMKILPAPFVQAWQGRLLNLHPSLLPNYPGLKSFERAWDDQAELGVTVHRVTADLDAGPLLVQRKFKRAPTFSETRLRLSWTEQSLVREVINYE
ncbi:MAG: formyltransferase family protein [Bdellovibrionales bacterium]